MVTHITLKKQIIGSIARCVFLNYNDVFLIFNFRLAMSHQTFTLWIMLMVLLAQHMMLQLLSIQLHSSTLIGSLRVKSLHGQILHTAWTLAQFLSTKNLHLFAQKTLYLTALFLIFVFSLSIAWEP